MRCVKPLSASLLTRCFEYRGRFRLGVSALLFSPLRGAPRLLPEQALWPFWGQRPEAQWPLEEGFPRLRAEYLVGGTAFPGPGRRACRVQVRVGALAKELAVFGRRGWQEGRPSVPLEFESLALDWTRTYGGEDFPENPLGMGRRDSDIEGVRLRLLPQVEYPGLALTSPTQAGRPAGFGPLDQTWALRAGKRGTYGERWFKEEYPGIASDVDWSFFNVAPEDQQQEAPFRGDEPFVCVGLHPREERIEGRLPGLAVRAFATRREEQGAVFQELPMRLMTLWLFPAEERLIQVFQGWLEVREDDAADVDHLLAAVEWLGRPRPPEHYRAVRDRRLDRRDGALEALRESDLVPAELAVSLFATPPSPMPGLERGMQRARRERLAARDLVAACGLDPDEHGPPAELPPPPEIRSIDDLIALREKMERDGAELPARMAAQQQAAMDAVRAGFEAGGQDFSRIEREVAGEETRGPPRLAADRMIADLTAQVERGGAGVEELARMLADPEVIAGWRKGDQDQLAGYRTMGHHQKPARALDATASASLRERILARLAERGSLAGWELTGADLSGLDLAGADLRLALLESADLSGARLNGADLGGAMLAHACLSGTLLTGVHLAGANLGGAQLEETDLEGADLGEAILEGALLRRTRLVGARLDGVRLEGARLEAVDFSGSHSEALLLLRGRDLRGCRFAGARYAQAVFLACDLRESDLSGLHIGKAVFATVQAAGVRLRGLQLDSGCFAAGSVLEGADLSAARLNQVSLRGTSLGKADLSQAALNGADLSECDLRGARLRGADARGARFVRAELGGADLGGCNLAGAVLQHARLGPTDFRQANLHEADLARVRIGAEVRFDGALFSRVRTRPRHRAAPGG